MSTMTDEQCAVMRKTLEHIIGNPSEYDQREWGVQVPACGTRFCFAGHAAVTVAGGTPGWHGDVLKYVRPPGSNDNLAFPQSVASYAEELLGLTLTQGSTLFASDNTLRRVAELCYLYSDGRVDLIDQVGEPNDLDVERERAQAYRWYHAPNRGDYRDQ